MNGLKARMVPIDVDSAKIQFSRLLERVAQGEEVVIAKAGEPMAQLVPVEPAAGRAT
jgi:prevent-host-death family protein